jgi:hypothetical protein
MIHDVRSLIVALLVGLGATLLIDVWAVLPGQLLQP